MLGEKFTFTLQLDNTDLSLIGYDPIIELVIPILPDDGEGGLLPDSNTQVFSVDETSYLGNQVLIQFVGNFDDITNELTNPITGATVSGNSGEALYILHYPLSSVAPDQPTPEIEIEATLNALTPISLQSISAKGIFNFGNDPTGQSAPIEGTVDTDTFTPTILEITKELSYAEHETATGPTFPGIWSLVGNIAEGATIDQLQFTDALPDGFYVTSATVIRPAGGVLQLAGTNPGHQLTVDWPSASGSMVNANREVLVEIAGYVPEVNGSAALVLPTSVGESKSQNQFSANYHFERVGIEPDGGLDISLDSNTLILDNLTVATQKSAAMENDALPIGYSPLDTISFLINIQVSDFKQVNALKIEEDILTAAGLTTEADILGDALTFDSSFTPVYDVSINGVDVSGSFDSANYSISVNPNDHEAGTARITFDLSQQLIDDGKYDSTGILTGAGLLSSSSSTTASIRYQATIDVSFDSPSSGDSSVDILDTMSNSVDIIAYDQIDNILVGDESSVSIQMQNASLAHTIERIVTVEGETIDTPPSGQPISPGDIVTFSINFLVPTGDLEDLQINDFLPYSLFSVNDVNGDGITGDGPFFTSELKAYPTVGEVSYGPSDEYLANYTAYGAPDFTYSVANNSLSLNYGDIDSPSGNDSDNDSIYNFEVRMTLTAGVDDLPDDFTLTSLAQLVHGSTNSGEADLRDFAGLKYSRSVPVITKGVIACSNSNAQISPAATSYYDNAGSDGNCTDAQAGDLVQFAITIQNTGTDPISVMTLEDTLPAQLDSTQVRIVSINRADGIPIITSPTVDGIMNSSDELALLNGTLKLDHSIQNNHLTTGTALGAPYGSETLIITLEAPISASTAANELITNIASTSVYYADGIPADGPYETISDTATVRMESLEFSKSMTIGLFGDEPSTVAVTINDESVQTATIGEIVTYDLEVSVPQGVTDSMILSDSLPSGLEFISVSGVKAHLLSMHSDLSSENLSTGDTNVSSDSITVNGSSVTFDFGNITHLVDGDNTLRNIVVRLYALVQDSVSNAGGNTVTNTANLNWDSGSSNATSSFNIARPNVEVTTALSPLSGSVVQAGTTMRVDVTLSNIGTESALSTAYDLILQSLVDSDFFDVSTVSELVTPATFTYSTITQGDDLLVDYGNIDLLPSESFSFSYTVDVKDDIVLPTTLQIPATGTGTSLPLAPPSGIEATESGDDTADLSTSFPTASKSRISTSEAHTENEFVTIGERTVYRITISMPEGVIEDLNVLDRVPNGLDFVGTNTDSNLAFPGFGYSISGPMGSLMSANLTGISDPDPTPDDSQTSDGNGDDITLQFGSITNPADGDDSNDYFTVDLELVTLDITENIGFGGTNKRLRNRARAESTGMTSDQGFSSFVSTYVVEPSLSLAKEFVTATGDANDTIPVQLTITNNGNSAAYDITLEDVIDGTQFKTDLIDVSATAPSGWTASTNTPINGEADATISLQSNLGTSLNPGASVTFDFDLITDDDINIPQTITNVAEVTSFSTLDASLMHPKGLRERISENVTASDDLTISGHSLTLSLTSTSENHTNNSTNPASLTIGERAVLRLDVNLPEGNSTAQNIYLQLPAGLDFVGTNPDAGLTFPNNGYGGFGGSFGSAAAAALTQVTDADPSPDDSTTVDGGGQLVIFEFDSLLNLPGGTNNDDFYFYVEVVAVDDTAAVIGFGDNQSQGSVIASLVDVDSSVSFQFVEPSLAISKTMSALSISNPDQTTITLEVTNNGLSTAFDIVVEDVIDSSQFDVGSVAVTSVESGFSSSIDEGILSFHSTGSSIGPSASVSFEFTCNVLPGASSPVTNTAQVNESSTLNNSLSQPEGIKERQLPIVSGDAELLIPNILLLKKVTDLNYTGAPLEAGDTIGYTLTVTNTSDVTASNVIIFDTIPEHTTYNESSLTVDGISQTPSLPNLNIDLGSIAAGQNKVIYFEVDVDLELDPSAMKITNTATATFGERSTQIISDNDPEGHDTTEDDNEDSEFDSGIDTDDDDPTVLPLLQAVTVERSYLAFEDLKNRGWNDWDHNDVVLDVTTYYVTDSSNNVEDVIVIYQMIARGAGHKHRINLRLPFDGSGSYNVTVLENDGTPVLSRTGSGTDEVNAVLYEWDWDTLVPYTAGRYNWGASRTERFDPTEAGRVAVVQITIDDPTTNPLVTFSESPHDTWLYSHSTNVDIHRIEYAVGDTQIAYEGPLYGRSLPFVVEFPEGFNWPSETKHIWDSHPDYVDYIKSGQTGASHWWHNYDPDLIWIDDEGNPPTLITSAPLMSIFDQVMSSYSISSGAGTLNDYSNLSLGLEEVDASSIEASLTWSTDLEIPVFASPIIRNITGGPELEILISALDGNVYLLDHNGNPLNGWPQATDIGVRVSPNAGDIDGDGIIDIVVGTPSGRLFAWDSGGNLKSGFPIELGESIHSISRLVDIDGIAGAEIIIHGGNSNLHALRHDGSPLLGWPQDLGGEADTFGRWLLASSPIVFDLKLDNSLQIAVGTTANEIALYNTDGTTVSGWPQATGDWVYSTITPVDLDGDYEPEIIAGSGDHNLYAWDAAGQLLDGFPVKLDSAITGSIAAADIDSDGFNELVVTTMGGGIYLIDRSGAIFDGWPIDIDAQITASPLIVDVNADGQLDIVAASRDNWLYAWDLQTTPLPEATYKTTDWIESTPAVGDIDADGLLEIVFASFDGSVNLIDLPTSADTMHGWNAFTGDRRTRLDSTNTDMDSDDLPDAFELVQFKTLAYNADDDFDNDGMMNISEWEAGTDANSAEDSFTMIYRKSPDSLTHQLVWKGHANRRYYVMRSEDLSVPFEDWELASGESTQDCLVDCEMAYNISDFGSKDAVFYKIMVYRTTSE